MEARDSVKKIAKCAEESNDLSLKVMVLLNVLFIIMDA
jgi:hypothetical protein